MIVLAYICFGLAWWLGLYLIERDTRTPYIAAIRLIGFGLVGYALILASESVRRSVTNETFADALNWLQASLVYLPALLLSAVIVVLVPAAWGTASKIRLLWWWVAGLLAVAILIGALFVEPPVARGSYGVVALLRGNMATAATQSLMVVAVGLSLTAVGWLLWPYRRRLASTRGPLQAIIALLAVIFITAVFVFPMHLLPMPMLRGLIGATLALLAVAVLMLTHQSMRQPGIGMARDLRRMIIVAITVTSLFGLEAVVAQWFGKEGTLFMLLLLAATPLAMFAVNRFTRIKEPKPNNAEATPTRSVK